MPTVEIPAQTIDPTGVAAGIKRFRTDLAGVSIRGFDWQLLAATIGLVAVSLIVLNAATKDDVPGSPDFYVLRQAAFGSVGLASMLLVSRLDYTRLREWRTQIYAFLIVSIVLVLALGSAARGSRRWIDVGFFQIQPSELGKVLIIAVLAAFVIERQRDRNAGRMTMGVIGLASLPAALIFLQPDLGTALVYGAITLTILFVAGVPWHHIAGILAAVAVLATLVLAAAPAAGINILKPYQVDRLTSFLSPGEHLAGQGYQQAQAQIAIGAGERTGRGTELATQTQLNFLPEHHTDFIFAVIGETYGFAGAAVVLTLYALLLWRALRIMASARDQFGTLLAAGVVAILMFQVFVNVGMNIGIMPITGVTLPLLSYGGASLIVSFVALGLLESVAIHSRDSRTAGNPLI
ncbi:MAG: rod shape-determining protein RodA [Solirubrobacterales bacterium]